MKERRRPVITQSIIEGIIDSTNEHVAGGDDNMIDAGVTRHPEQIAKANQWAFEMREWMRERKVWKEEKQGGKDGD